MQKFFESRKGVGTAVDYYLPGLLQHKRTVHLIKGVYVSVRLAMCTITGSRLGQQHSQRLRLEHRPI